MRTDSIKITPKWSKSKEDIWMEVFEGLEDKDLKPQPKAIQWRKLYSYVAAAAIIIAIFIPSFAYLYTNEVVVPKGKQLTFNFPDGSKAKINADTRLEYKPLWWKISRNVQLNGEAYFEVEKGNEFRVFSDKTSVKVLGTSFNVFARGEQYSVTCLTGKVEVSNLDQSVILTPNMLACYNGNELTTSNDENALQTISWTQGQFSFTSVPLSDVIKEIERQYDIQVVTNQNINYIYTGNFTKLKDPEQVLRIIEKPFGIKLEIKR